MAAQRCSKCGQLARSYRIHWSPKRIVCHDCERDPNRWLLTGADGPARMQVCQHCSGTGRVFLDDAPTTTERVQ